MNSLRSLRKHPSLVPLVATVGLGVVVASLYLGRLAVKSPEVSWNKKQNPEPWNEYDKKQYKFYSPNVDYEKLDDKRPTF
ncbi:cytochrome c oxidase subunit NDUFA4-like [Limulus polyphemus]|uniref:Cytochrome c oxidase subunit NDUFA4-like n=1 Tax=Limulus polyphemus TaxID=6850 RepID=A0ABM1BB03_LIMPO|nr:cytochrome c oxidase subunit NDUFA4-like [Limulus polyphemus]